LLRDGFDFSDNFVGLFDLFADIGRLMFQRFKGRDYTVIVQDLAFSVVERLKQRLLQLTEPQVEFT